MPNTPNTPNVNCPNCGPLPALPLGMAPKFCPACGAPLAIRASSVDVHPDEDRAFSAEELIGWRAWRVIELGKLIRLGSVTHQVKPWPVADWYYGECDRTDGGKHVCSLSTDGRVPGENCHCGLYAAKSYKQLTEELGYADYGTRGAEVRVIGQVGMAGKVIEGSQGWRAEKARIVHLYVPHTHWKLGKRISEQYGIGYDTLRWIG